MLHALGSHIVVPDHWSSFLGFTASDGVSRGDYVNKPNELGFVVANQFADSGNGKRNQIGVRDNKPNELGLGFAGQTVANQFVDFGNGNKNQFGVRGGFGLNQTNFTASDAVDERMKSGAYGNSNVVLGGGISNGGGAKRAHSDVASAGVSRQPTRPLHQLSTNLQGLPPEKPDAIVHIIKRRNLALNQHDDEIEVDIDSMDAETLWELDRFVTNYKKSLSKNKRRAEVARARAEALQNSIQRSQPPAMIEISREPQADERNVPPSLPMQGGSQADNRSRSSSSSSSSSDSGSSSSDSDSDSSSASGSDAGSQGT